MVISYRDKFVKVFFIFLVTLIIGVGLIVYELIQVQNALDYYNNGMVGESDTESFNGNIAVIGALIIAISSGFYIWSHYLLAKAKGYSGWWALSALPFNISFIGLAIIFLLPDKVKVPQSS